MLIKICSGLLIWDDVELLNKTIRLHIRKSFFTERIIRYWNWMRIAAYHGEEIFTRITGRPNTCRCSLSVIQWILILRKKVWFPRKKYVFTQITLQICTIGYFELLCLCLEGKNRMQLLGHGFPNAVSKSVTGRQLELVSQKRWLFYCSLMSSCVRLLLQMSDDALDCCQPPIRLLHLSVNSLFLIWTATQPGSYILPWLHL